MTEGTKVIVRRRAGDCCEYCRLHQKDSPLAAHHIEHIRPRKHGGSDDDTNLCLACIDCNLHKGPNLTGIDPLTGLVTDLFHPRLQQWSEHFAMEGIYIAGLSDVGRTTIEVLQMNSDEQLAIRAAG